MHVWSVELAQPPARVAGTRGAAERRTNASAPRGSRTGRAGSSPGPRCGPSSRANCRSRPASCGSRSDRTASPSCPGPRCASTSPTPGDRALIAVAGVEVGVDVERTARRSHAVERTLTAGERAAIGGADRHVELLRIWCRKEALAKAIGGGLGWAPETFDTSRPDGHVLADLDPGEGYVGAVALAGTRLELVLRRLDL